jgi:hypothetical protein
MMPNCVIIHLSRVNTTRAALEHPHTHLLLRGGYHKCTFVHPAPQMLGYISSTRRKSCTHCVKAKRRCNLGYPFCKRCYVKGLDCSYPNAARATVRNAEVIIRQTTPDITPPDLNVACSVNDYNVPAIQIDEIDANVNIDPLFLQAGSGSASSSDSCTSSPEASWQNDLEWKSDWLAPQEVVSRPQHHTTPTTRIGNPGRTLMPDVVLPVQLNSRQVMVVTEGLRTFIASMAYSGTTHFLHQNLYPDYEQQPQAYQDCVAISALYMGRNARNERILVNSINAKISALVAQSRSWTLTQHLAAVQALIIYQIIRLFDPSLSVQEQAVQHSALLERLSASLWKRSFSEAPSFPDAYSTWVFHESVRRTILVSVFTRCGWSAFTRGGLANQVHVLARLPLSRDMGKWNRGPNDWGNRLSWEDRMLSEEESLISYGDMSQNWRHDEDLETLGGFGKLLLAPCRGADDPRLLV